MRADEWQPILEGETSTRAEARVGILLEAIGGWPLPPDLSLGDGHAGLAVVYAYLSRARGLGASSACGHLERAVEGLASQVMGPGFFGGFSGIAWAHEHVVAQLGMNDSEDAADDLDGHLLQLLELPKWERDYDLVEGLVGLGVYALERLPHSRAEDMLDRIVDHLDRTSESTPEGLTWLTPPRLLPMSERERHPNGYYNLGVAHGVPGVVALLAAIVAHTRSAPLAGRLLDGAVDWLWAHRLPEGRPGRFATLLEGKEGEAARLAWCYGDAGIAAAFAAAASALGDVRLRRMAVSLGLVAAARDPGSSGVVDAGLCHGAAGVGHVFNRLFQSTQEEAFLAAARAWFGRAIDLQQEGLGIAGYPSWRVGPDGRVGWQPDPGLLTGTAGIAAALLAATSAAVPEWDRFLLVSLRPAGDCKLRAPAVAGE